MAVLNDYKCAEHGFFEGFEPVCPDGCTENVHVVFQCICKRTILHWRTDKANLDR